MVGVGGVHNKISAACTEGTSQGSGGVSTGDFDLLLAQAVEEKVKSDIASAAASQDEKLREAAQELEAILVQQMLSAMRSTVPEVEGIFAKSSAHKTFESMLDIEYSKLLGENAGFGFAEAIYRQLAKHVAEKE